MFNVRTFRPGLLRNLISLLVISFVLPSFFSPARADDASLGRKGETVRMVGDSQVEMVSEDVTVTVSAVRSRVDCRFTFKNTGPGATVLMGFPESKPPSDREGFGDDAALHDFQTFIDGRQVPVKKEKGDSLEDKKAAEAAGNHPYWWTWEVPFKAGETREVRNTYWVKNHYWSNGQVMAGYILTTGSSWKGPIGRARVVFRFEDVLPYDLVKVFPGTYRFEGNDLVWEWTDLEPQGDIEIIFNTRRWTEIPVQTESGQDIWEREIRSGNGSPQIYYYLGSLYSKNNQLKELSELNRQIKNDITGRVESGRFFDFTSWRILQRWLSSHLPEQAAENIPDGSAAPVLKKVTISPTSPEAPTRLLFEARVDDRDEDLVRIGFSLWYVKNGIKFMIHEKLDNPHQPRYGPEGYWEDLVFEAPSPESSLYYRVYAVDMAGHRLDTGDVLWSNGGEALKGENAQDMRHSEGKEISDHNNSFSNLIKRNFQVLIGMAAMLALVGVTLWFRGSRRQI